MVRRTTTGMSLNLYRHNLSGTTSRLATSQGKVLSHRKFDSYAEDPSSATQAWRVRRAMVNTSSYIKNTHDTYTRFNIAWSTLDVASYKLTDLDGRSADIYAASDPTASGRVALGRVLMQTAESVAQVLNNAKAGEDFVFAGDDELNAPFSWVEIDGKKVLHYRGVNVNAGKVPSPAGCTPDWVPLGADGKPAKVTDKAALAKAYRDSFLSKAPVYSIDTENPQELVNAQWEQEWIKYYNGEGPMPDDATKPSTTVDATTFTAQLPTWVPLDGGGNPVKDDDAALARAYVNSLPDPAETDIEQAWVDYYKSVPDWVPLENGEPVDADKTEALAQAYRDTLPTTSTAADPYDNKWEQAWMDYYHGVDGAQKPEANDPQYYNAGVPADPADYKTAPGWVPKDDGGEPVENTDSKMKEQFLKNLPNPAKTDIDQKWVDYYKKMDPAVAPKPTVVTPKPTEDPTEEWIKKNGVDNYGTPMGMTDILNSKIGDKVGGITVSAYARVWASYLKDQGDVKKLEAMSKEKMPVDLGMGLLEHDRSNLINGTYFNRSLPGIEMLGWGVDEDGDPKNVCMIMMRLGEIYADCNPESGNYDHDVVSGHTEKAEARYQEAMRLLDKLKLGKEYVTDQSVQTTTKASFLKQTEDRLTLQGDYLNEQLTGLEDVDLADAITQFSWDYYCYSAALKVGTQLLSQSLIDYMS